jgi:hypothetical protein
MRIALGEPLQRGHLIVLLFDVYAHGRLPFWAER